MIRRNVLLLGLGAVLATTFPALALDRALTPEETQLIQQIGAHNSAIRTMAGRFLQVDSQGGRTEGTFFLERPNKVRFRYNPPSREEIISVGRGFYVINRKDQTQYAYPQDRIPLRNFLGDKIDLLTANIVDVTTSDAYMAVTISDDTPIGVVQVGLIFDKQTLDLAQWTLTEPSGAELTFSLYDIQKDVQIPKSYFYIDPTYKAVQPK
ncbi:MAG: outer membrane lipoprotein carrier protein LolA [Devosia nanyangense]|jgi:outer membrane lipoprotein-sorting protein|nr:outer membrane lipoprotein carrier protein LolA [Devosia nanyangense]